jgi:hypothetical protein
MKKTAIAFLAISLFAAQSAFAANAVRISQVYGGGGGGSSYYIYDHVELFNSSNAPVDISGWAVEYGSATGNWGSSTGNIFNFPPGTLIQPCSYLVIQTGSASSNPGAIPLPVTPDFATTGVSMSNSNGKVALFSATNSNVPCGSELPGTLVDKVAWGTGNCPEGTAIAAFPDQLTIAVRNGDGLADTDDNSADFTNTPAASVTVHNSASPPNPNCNPVSTEQSSWGSVKSQYNK